MSRIPNFANIAFENTARAAALPAAPSRGSRPKASWSSRATAKPISKASISSRPGPASRPICAAPTRRCMSTSPGPIRQYAGFSTAEDSNAFYRRNLAAGQKGLSVAFDLATHRGYDFGSSARHRRCRHGRRRDRFDLRHAHAVLRHSARPDERVDDHERRGAADPGAVRRRRRGTGRAAGETLGHHSERHSERVHGAQHLHLSAGALDADHLRHLCLHLAEDAEIQFDLDLRLSHAGSRRDAGPRARLYAGRRRRISPRRPRRRASTSTASHRGCRSSGRSA